MNSRIAAVAAVALFTVCSLAVVPLASDDSDAAAVASVTYGSKFTYEGNIYGFVDGEIYLPSGVSVKVIPVTGYLRPDNPGGTTIGVVNRSIGTICDVTVSAYDTSLTIGAAPVLYTGSDITPQVTWTIQINRSAIIGSDSSGSSTYTHTATLAYAANSGSGAPSFQTASYSSSSSTASGSVLFTISDSVPTKSGCEFLGWSTSSSASSATYQPGDSLSVSYGSTVTLYAVWSEAATVYTLIYLAVGPATLTTVTASEGSYTVIDVYAEYEYHVFSGWLCSDGNTYQPGDVITLSSDLSFTGQWTSGECVLTFDSTGGSEVASITVLYGETVSEIPVPTRDDYEFVWWVDSSSLFVLKSDTVIESDMSFYAVWTWASSVRCVDSASSTDTTAQLSDTGSIVWLPEPVRSGYTLQGWFYYADDGSIVQLNVGDQVSTNIEAFAQWVESDSGDSDEPGLLEEIAAKIGAVLVAIAVFFFGLFRRH